MSFQFYIRIASFILRHRTAARESSGTPSRPSLPSRRKSSSRSRRSQTFHWLKKCKDENGEDRTDRRRPSKADDRRSRARQPGRRRRPLSPPEKGGKADTRHRRAWRGGIDGRDQRTDSDGGTGLLRRERRLGDVPPQRSGRRASTENCNVVIHAADDHAKFCERRTTKKKTTKRGRPSLRTNRVGRGLSLNRSQCGGCSTKYDTPSLKSSGLRAIPRLTLHGGFETRRRRQNPACRGCQVGWPVRARRRGCDDGSTAPGRRANPPPEADHRRHWRRRPLWQAPAERKETPFVIPWRHRSRFRLRGFQPLSRGGSLAPSLVRASTRTVAPIPRFLSYWTG